MKKLLQGIDFMARARRTRSFIFQSSQSFSSAPARFSSSFVCCVLGRGLFAQETLGYYQLCLSSQPGLLIRVGCPSWSLTTHLSSLDTCDINQKKSGDVSGVSGSAEPRLLSDITRYNCKLKTSEYILMLMNWGVYYLSYDSSKDFGKIKKLGSIFFAGGQLFLIMRLCRAVLWHCSKVRLGWRHSHCIC